MAGHNKWSKIKHKKAATDAAKSKIFGKLVRLIQVEAKKANGDTNSPGLASAIAKALKANMPKDNIERAIKKASDAGEAQEVMYEAYGPAGVGIIITGLTDNTNRTSAEIKHTLSKHNGSLGAQGSVSWNFQKNAEQDWEPNTTIELSEQDEEKLERLIDALDENDDVQDVYHNAA
jgi:YebC/PmpR family DNA-binding regulatory protein